MCIRDRLMKSYTFGLFSALMAIEQWGFFSVPHLLWHKTSVYNGHLRGPVTLTPVAERLAVESSLPVLTTEVCRDRISNPDLPYARRTLFPLSHRGGVTLYSRLQSRSEKIAICSDCRKSLPPSYLPTFSVFWIRRKSLKTKCIFSKSLKSFSFSLTFALVAENRCHLPPFSVFWIRRKYVYLVSI